MKGVFGCLLPLFLTGTSIKHIQPIVHALLEFYDV